MNELTPASKLPWQRNNKGEIRRPDVPGLIAYGIREQDCKYLIHACNVYPAHFAALQACESLLDDLADGAPDNPVGRRAGVALMQVRAALAS